jgi:hypothetical protein
VHLFYYVVPIYMLATRETTSNFALKRIIAIQFMCQNFDLRFLHFYCLLSVFFFFRPFSFFCGLVFYCLSPFSVCFFIALRFFPSFSPLFCLCFSAHVSFISSLPILLGTKRLGYCCCCHYLCRLGV